MRNTIPMIEKLYEGGCLSQEHICGCLSAQQNPMILFDGHDQCCQIAAIAVLQYYNVVEFQQTTIVPPCAISTKCCQIEVIAAH
ncbi:hypothetical protein QL285_066468 [Trifolium repens]|jgi:hypothetical protein|nr:hypothetical protein QL285_066468 [Trifolium repens]